MSRQDANAAFARTSFLYGGNAAYIEDLYARYETDPASVDAEWRDFFAALKDEKADVVKSAARRLLEEAELAAAPERRLVAALDGQWAETEKKLGEKISAKAQATGVALTSADVQQATRDSIHALMLIRAYRMRGHFHAKLDPLGIQAEPDEAELDPRSYGFTEADMDRRIFLDNVLGLEFASMREIVAILRRTYCQTLGVEFMHISNPAQKAWIQERIEGKDKEIQLHARRQARDPEQAGGSRRLREIPRRQIHRHQALRPGRRRIADPGARADHQARRQSRREGNRASACRIAAA